MRIKNNVMKATYLDVKTFDINYIKSQIQGKLNTSNELNNNNENISNKKYFHEYH